MAQFAGVTDMAEACNLILAACMRVTDAGGGTLPSYHPYVTVPRRCPPACAVRVRVHVQCMCSVTPSISPTPIP